MPQEKSVGAIIFYKEGGQPLYLLLHYPSLSTTRVVKKKDYWDYPKGHVERGETEEQTVRREICEETGLQDLQFVPGFRETINYIFQAKGKRIFKTVVFYLARARTKNVVLSHEHTAFLWLPFGDAMKKLKFANARKLLEKAHPLVEK